VFNLAKENNELGNHILNKKGGEDEYANKEMVDKIEKIENLMVSKKNWQLIGEASSKDRPLNSLLEVHLDFNTASKLPPTITKEKTNSIEGMIK
jgi:U3 small nucleolar RNA-associated protein MPP10